MYFSEGLLCSSSELQKPLPVQTGRRKKFNPVIHVSKLPTVVVGDNTDGQSPMSLCFSFSVSLGETLSAI
jgi:hypothetical protein